MVSLSNQERPTRVCRHPARRVDRRARPEPSATLACARLGPKRNVSLEELLLLPLGLVSGAYGTIIGAGGGFVLVPALLLLYSDKPADQLTAISLTVVLLTGISASIAYGRQRRIDYLTALLLGAATVPGGIVGALAVHGIPRPGFDVAFGVLLLAVGAFILGRREVGAVRAPLTGPSVLRRELAAEDGEIYHYTYPLPYGLGMSGGVGFLAGLFGIGGGVVQMPMMISVLRIPLPVAVATSTLMIVFVSASAVGVHAVGGELAGHNLVIALLLAAGAVPGAQLGAFLARRFASTTVTGLLVAALALVGIRLILRGFV